MTTIDVPGHLRGHLGLRIGDEAVLIADAAVHPALLDESAWVYVADDDAQRSVATRREPGPPDQDVVGVCGHYPDGGIGASSPRRSDRLDHP